jgi:hypothetical protein
MANRKRIHRLREINYSAAVRIKTLFKACSSALPAIILAKR